MADIKCPHCGDERDADAPEDYLREDETEVRECGNCGKEYEITHSISHSWDTTCVTGQHKLVPSDRHPGWFNCEVCDEFMQDDGSPKTGDTKPIIEDIPF